ncbi:MAG: hypothetical protein ABJD97_14065 [Betaproteobacteria bacterium]
MTRLVILREVAGSTPVNDVTVLRCWGQVLHFALLAAKGEAAQGVVGLAEQEARLDPIAL